MNKPHKHAELIKAWADGAKIECYCRFTGKWFYQPSPTWTASLEYRIKPVKNIMIGGLKPYEN